MGPLTDTEDRDRKKGVFRQGWGRVESLGGWRQGEPEGAGGLTLVQGRRHAALHPRCVVVHNVDGDVGVPVGDHFYRPIVLGPLRGDRGSWGSEAPAPEGSHDNCDSRRAATTVTIGQPHTSLTDPTPWTPSHLMGGWRDRTQACRSGWDHMLGCKEGPLCSSTLKGHLPGPLHREEDSWHPAQVNTLVPPAHLEEWGRYSVQLSSGYDCLGLNPTLPFPGYDTVDKSSH